MSVNLSATQREIVEHREGALLVVAGPGSGKTRVLTERVRLLLSEPEEHFRVLALTFTNKAANEMKERLSDVPDIQRAFVGTLHSFCMEVLGNRGDAVGIDGLPNIFESWEDRKQVLANAVRDSSSLTKLLRSQGDSREQQKALGRWLERISEIKGAFLALEMIDDDDERQIFEAYNTELRASAAIDYDDLLLLTYELFETRPRIADLYRRQYRYICIDEAQDLNESQYRLLSSLCGESYRNILMVGDPKQAIYVWNGADPVYLKRFTDEFGAKVIELTENYRCSEAVVEAAKALDDSYQVEGQLPIKGLLEVVQLADEQQEAQFVSEKIQSLCRTGHHDVEGDITPGRCAVLARNRFVFGALEEQLESDGQSYYLKVSTASYRSESEVLKDFELVMRLIANPRDRLHRDILARSWGIAPQTAVTVFSSELAIGEQVKRLASESTVERAKLVLQACDALGWTGDQAQFVQAMDFLEKASESMNDHARALLMQDIKEWRKHWDYYVRSGSAGSRSISTFLGQIALGTTQQPREEGIALLTVHSAKGMEFDVIFLIGMTEGTFPDYRAQGKSLEEEQRSAFVAVTRSKRLLYVTYPAKKRMPWGDIKAQSASRYLTAIDNC
jgi:DNA helicase II / ATP-dependent DNA helicase PcrA